MLILGIESTCDETGVALVKDGRTILKNVISSSVPLHKEYGGVIPEIAAREQIKIIIPLIEQAIESVPISQIDAIAVSYGPGLIGSLLIGVETAKTLAVAWNKKLIAVNHLVGHFYSNWLDGRRDILFPAVALVVSGGHTDLLFFKNKNSHKLLGSTMDDAAGEAFDKVAKVLGLGYPGGPAVESCAEKFTRKGELNPFPKPLLKSGDYNFSFSGLKTAALYYVRGLKTPSSSPPIRGYAAGEEKRGDIAASIEQAIIDVLVAKTVRAAKDFHAKTVLLGGGVSANKKLRRELATAIKKNLPDSKFYIPDSNLTTDNAGMIAFAGYNKYTNGKAVEYNKIGVNPNFELKSWK